MLKDEKEKSKAVKINEKDLGSVNGGTISVNIGERAKTPNFMGWTCPKCGASVVSSRCSKCGYSRS